MQADEASSRFSNLEATGAKGIFLRGRSLPILVGLALLTATLILWQALLAQEHTDTQQAIQLEAANAKFEITRQLQERTQALERMAKRWEIQGKPPREYWEADARSYIEDYGGFQAIEWADSSFHIRWIVPLKGNEVAQNLDLTLEPRRRMALEAARNQHQITLTRTINLKQGGQGFLVYIPISQEQNFDGFILGVFHTQKFLDNIFNDLDKRVGRKYGLTIFDGDEKIYSHYLSNPINEKKWGQDTSISFNGVTWRMRVWPEQALLAKQHSPLPTVTLISGLLMAILLALAIDLAQIARRRSKKVATVNQELQAEIVQRQQVQEALNRHAQMLDLANDTIMIRDLDNSITYWNQGAERLYGWTKQEVLGQFVHEFLQTEFPKPLEEIRNAFLRQGYWQGELLHTKRDGTQVTVESRWTLQQDDQGQPSAILEINNDITQRKRAEQRLRAQYVTARVLAESASLSEATPQILQALCDSLGWDVGEFWSVNQQANVLDFVTAWYQPSVKIPEFEAVTRSITFAPGVGLPGHVWDTRQSIWIADIVQDDKVLRAAVIDKAGLHGAFGFPILDSKEVLGVITFFSREIRQPDNDLLEMVTAIGRQIGQFIDRKQAQEALEQQRRWLEVTLSSIGDAVIATDTAAIITFMNPVAEALTGWTIQDALGRKIDEVFCIIHEYTRQAAEIPVERALREGIVVELAENTTLITRDGREIPIDDSCASMRDKNGTLQGAVLIFRDITKRKQAEKALQQAKEQLQAVLDAVPGCISWINSSLHYLGVNRQLAAICNLLPEDFEGQKVGVFNSNYEFAEQVREFFASPDPETSLEIDIAVDGSPQTYSGSLCNEVHPRNPVF
jgi:PAS domain S-box-containing protein